MARVTDFICLIFLIGFVSGEQVVHLLLPIKNNVYQYHHSDDSIKPSLIYSKTVKETCIIQIFFLRDLSKVGFKFYL